MCFINNISLMRRKSRRTETCSGEANKTSKALALKPLRGAQAPAGMGPRSHWFQVPCCYIDKWPKETLSKQFHIKAKWQADLPFNLANNQVRSR